MTFFKTTIIAAIAATCLSGCLINVRGPALATPTKMDATRMDLKGEATCYGILWTGISWGDCSVDAAMKNGNLNKVHHVDSQFTNILFGVYGHYTTVVHGE